MFHWHMNEKKTLVVLCTLNATKACIKYAMWETIKTFNIAELAEPNLVPHYTYLDEPVMSDEVLQFHIHSNTHHTLCVERWCLPVQDMVSHFDDMLEFSGLFLQLGSQEQASLGHCLWNSQWISSWKTLQDATQNTHRAVSVLPKYGTLFKVEYVPYTVVYQ